MVLETEKIEAAWDGKSRGTVLGFKVFVFFIKHFGINAAYALMHLPVPYFCIKERKNWYALFAYFNKRLGYSKWKSVVSIYKTYYVFGQSLVDKVAISIGFRNKYTFEFDGEGFLRETAKTQKGGILISAHLGNFELAQYFFRERMEEIPISVVITDQDHQEIKEYFEQFLQRKKTHFIIIKDDFSHVFEMHKALQENRIICITGDRYLNAVKFLEAEILGKKAKFPIGPFHLATRLKVPVFFVYVMREPKMHYHLFARRIEVKYNNAQDLLEKYVVSLESMIAKYPTQWFNFYDFWDDRKKE